MAVEDRDGLFAAVQLGSLEQERVALERQIDDFFFEHGIAHHPEPHYPYDPDINPDGYRADWRLADGTYVEALGFTANPVYMAKAQRKIALAEQHQITRETQDAFAVRSQNLAERARADGKFADDLVGACVKMVREWNPQPKPTWVTCIPSLRHPDLVPDLAKRLAAALGLPFHMVIAKTDDRPEQKTMANSTQQARNIDGSLEINGQPVPRGPVLLVDDMVDSRWTLTVAAWLLRKSGSGDVWPMALSQTGHDE